MATIHQNRRSERKSALTLSSLYRKFLSIHKSRVKPSTYAKYVQNLQNYLLPRFGDTQVTKITRSDLLQFIQFLSTSGGIRKRGLAAGTVNGILSDFKVILNYARLEKGINVVNTQRLSASPAPASCLPFRILSDAEMRRLCAYCQDHLTGTTLGILIACYTGLRIGEVCALKWEDVDIVNRTLRVHHTLQRISAGGNAGDGGNKMGTRTEVIITSPKSHSSIRSIPIPEELFTSLEMLYQEHVPAASDLADLFLLTGKRRFMEPRGLTYHFHKALSACAIDRSSRFGRCTGSDSGGASRASVTFHTLRHSMASKCIELGFDVKTLSEILGHANVSITLNRYVHPSMDLKRKSMNRVKW